MITVSALNDLPAVRHAFFSRVGGVSDGIYGSLNCGLGSRDDRQRVIINRGRAMEMIDQPPVALTTVHQAHTSQAVVVEGPRQGDPPVADAMVTNVPGVALGIVTADCAPILFADRQAGVVGAAHAGWRGALGGVVEATVAAMERLGAVRKDMTAVIGPCIGFRSYEVGPEFPAPFLVDEGNLRFFEPSHRPGHHLFDLAGYVARRIAGTGVAVHRTPCDTFREEQRFFSFRRATLRGEPDYGRQLSVIVLED